MIPALLAQIGLPLLAKLIGGAVEKIDHPAARAAGEALSGLGAAIAGRDIPPEALAAANRHLERLAEIESAEAAATIAQVNETFRAEVSSEDAFVRRWRPTFGYAVAGTWSAVMGAISFAIVADPKEAPAIINAMVNTAPIWGIALGVLGVAVVKRSQDKALGAGLAPKPFADILAGWVRR